MHFPHLFTPRGDLIAPTVDQAPPLSDRARQWLAELSGPDMWCEPEHAQPLMHALAMALVHTSGFPAGYGVVVLDEHGEWSHYCPDRSRGMLFVVARMKPGGSPPTDGGMLGFQRLPNGGVAGGAYGPREYRGRGGDAFFHALVGLMDIDGSLSALMARHHERAGRSEDMLRRLLARQLAERWPSRCNALATTVPLRRGFAPLPAPREAMPGSRGSPAPMPTLAAAGLATSSAPMPPPLTVEAPTPADRWMRPPGGRLVRRLPSMPDVPVNLMTTGRWLDRLVDDIWAGMLAQESETGAAQARAPKTP